MKITLKVLLGTLILALAGMVYATVTINGDACGELSGNVTISATGDVTINTDSTLCGYNRGSGGSGGGEDPPPVVTYNLNISASNGSVVRNPTGTGGCGTGCFSYNSNTSVTLSANPNSGYTFASWSGCDTTSGNSCTVNMTANRSVTASFTPVVVSGDCPTPAGSNVVRESFPSQLTPVNFPANTILSMPLPQGSGKLMAFKNNLSSSANRSIVISTCPGDIYSSGKSRGCTAAGSENVTIWYSSNGGSGCDVSDNGPYFINVSHYNSISGRLGCTSSNCGYTLAP